MSLKVKGDSGTDYEISYIDEKYVCTCPDFKFRGEQRPCKHIKRALDEKLLSYNRPTGLDERYKERIYFVKIIDLLPGLLADLEYRHAICGSWRRENKYIKDLDVIVLLKAECLEELKDRIELIGTISSGGDSRIIAMFEGVQVDFRLFTNPIYFGSMLLHCTGSKNENIRLRRCAIRLGLRLNEYGLFDSQGTWVCGKEEKDIYAALEEPYKDPKERS